MPLYSAYQKQVFYFESSIALKSTDLNICMRKLKIFQQALFHTVYGTSFVWGGGGGG